MPFTKLTGYSKLIANLSDSPNENMSAMELKQYWDSSPEEARQAINRLIDELESSSGSKLIGAENVEDLTGSTIQDLIISLKRYIDEHKLNGNNPHNVTAAQLGVYTKEELIPFLQGGDTLIVEEVYIVVNANKGDGTFTYKDTSNNVFTGELTTEGYQIFEFQNGNYSLGMNRVECIVNDSLRRSVQSGGLLEVSDTSVALTIPAAANTEVTFKYFQRIGITGEHNVVVGTVQPPMGNGETLWFKVL